MHPDREPIDPDKPKWLSYEELAACLLNRLAKEFGLEFVEGKQEVQGNRSGTTFEIDAKGIIEGGERFFIVECKRYPTKRVDQGELSGLAYRILDTGADGAIFVSPMGLQEGAKKIAAAENLLSVQLHENSTPTDFAMQFLNNIYMCFSDISPRMPKMRQDIPQRGTRNPLRRLPMILPVSEFNG
jgi:hypothetical protein